MMSAFAASPSLGVFNTQTRVNPGSHPNARAGPLQKLGTTRGQTCQACCLSGGYCLTRSAFASAKMLVRRPSATGLRLREDFRNGTTTAALAEEAPSSSSGDGADELWNSLKKELLTIGKSGVGKGHKASLRDLLAQHPEGVKVKLNHTSADVDQAIADLTGETTGAKFVQRKGRTLLFVPDGPVRARTKQAKAFTRQAGQWVCACGFDNFASRTECFKCKKPKVSE
mmetsp:Transcript_9152/g.18931  ORF Transcript_9152/g.18931 Transcript_9152/m.18931 type:complete len:227 (-) Transcript_9152:42-722(-)|eukprot:CAMPEP_0118938958 /NCGR_PEP_ID=MMETSP1169-20130426/27560_1 /TAXON_ID=36882 /ORGANISM="Pyramimonas obovata, Strain CCMP722" /LENGTH=226 /DNA_ID=CAMNT_0006883093 /DNA_START=41 /DNA_END=721 /DNA_ORIENTATION=+